MIASQVLIGKRPGYTDNNQQESHWDEWAWHCAYVEILMETFTVKTFIKKFVLKKGLEFETLKRWGLKIELKKSPPHARILFGNKGHVVGPFFHCPEMERYGTKKYTADRKTNNSLKSVIKCPCEQYWRSYRLLSNAHYPQNCMSASRRGYLSRNIEPGKDVL